MWEGNIFSFVCLFIGERVSMWPLQEPVQTCSVEPHHTGTHPWSRIGCIVCGWPSTERHACYNLLISLTWYKYPVPCRNKKITKKFRHSEFSCVRENQNVPNNEGFNAYEKSITICLIWVLIFLVNEADNWGIHCYTSCSCLRWQTVRQQNNERIFLFYETKVSVDFSIEISN